MKRNTAKHPEAAAPTYTVVRHVISGANSGLKEHETWKVYLEGGLVVTAHRRSARSGQAGLTRVYGALDALVPQLMELEPFTTEALPGKPEHADDKVKSAMWTAWKNATVKEAKALLEPLLTAVAEDLSLYRAAAKNIRFSQTAGCSCPCSPGFIIDGLWDNSDLWVTVDEDAATAS